MRPTPPNQQTGPATSRDEARAALEQASRTSAVAPRDRTVYAAGTALFGVALGAFVPLNWREQTTTTAPWLLVLVGVVIALPMLVAGAVIARRRA
jgi:hypothetical protein